MLSERDIVDGEVRATDASRRNRNARVTTTLGQNYFVKQALDAERAETIRREAAFLQRAADSASGARLATFLPTLRDWDAERDMLVFELDSDSRSLAEQHRRSRRWSAALAGQAGTGLAALHTCRSPAAESTGTTVAHLGPPWILVIHQPEIGVLDTMSGAGLEIVRIVQGAVSVPESLDTLRESWQTTTLIHGDIKWDNFVVSRASAGRDWRLRLVDWELVQLGDPLWDAGSFLSQYLDAWISSIPVVDYAGLSRSARSAVPLERLQPTIRRFWATYTDGRGLEGAGGALALERVTRYAAARLIQTCVEAEQHAARLSNTSILRLQVAQNMLQRPMMAAVSLFGITD